MIPVSYEDQQILNAYLLFHYGSSEEQIGDLISKDVLGPETVEIFKNAGLYASKTIELMLDIKSLSRENTYALDVGCSVGRSTFELAKHCNNCLGIDYSKSFIQAANAIKNGEILKYKVQVEGEYFNDNTLDGKQFSSMADKCNFQHGDAQALELETKYDVIHAANLLCRLQKPSLFLEKCIELLAPGAQLIICSPYSWLEEFTPKANWIGGTKESNSKNAVKNFFLDKGFILEKECEIPFLIREHSRKLQFSTAHSLRLRTPLS